MATAVSTLFELPLDQLSASTSQYDAAELTAAALAALDLRAAAAATATEPAAEEPARPSSSGPTCIACGIGVGGAPGFASAEEQRRHFSLDWHRYNVKRRAAGRPAVSEAAFDALVEDEGAEVGSISGSESEASEDEEQEGGERGGAAAAGPQFAFTAADGKRYAVWRSLVAPDRAPGAAAAPAPSAEQCLASLRAVRQHGGRWAVIMLRGGHFAAAVFTVEPARVGNPRQADKFGVLAHKSAHRYVVRAGQGGRQSAKDASGKYARSAGSRLRRYNEAALQRDVEEALGGWAELLGGCDMVFVHAPSSNWQQLFGGEAPLLDRNDARIRRVPFTTRRPTFSETKRIMRILVTLYQLPDPPAGGEQSAAAAAGATAGAGEAAAQQQRQRQQQPAAAQDDGAAALAAEAAAAEEEARRKKAEKRARQKAKQKEQRQAEAAASRAAAEEEARHAADDEIGRAAAAVAAMSGKLTAKPAPVSGGAGKASGGAAPPPRLSAKPRANEGADVRRARMAAAAEARMKALQEAAKAQQLH